MCETLWPGLAAQGTPNLPTPHFEQRVWAMLRMGPAAVCATH